MAASATHTFSANELEPQIRPDLSVELPISLEDGTYAKGTTLGRVTASSKYKAYADAAVDGSGDARGFLKYACTVASGVITLLGDHGEDSPSVPMFLNGFFRSQDLVGLDAAGLANLGGRIIYGDLTSGLIYIP